MDPDENLREQEEIETRIAHYLKALAHERTAEERQFIRAELRDDRARLRELRDALGHWLSRGGAQPEWSKYPHAARYYNRVGA